MAAATTGEVALTPVSLEPAAALSHIAIDYGKGFKHVPGLMSGTRLVRRFGNQSVITGRFLTLSVPMAGFIAIETNRLFLYIVNVNPDSGWTILRTVFPKRKAF